MTKFEDIRVRYLYEKSTNSIKSRQGSYAKATNREDKKFYDFILCFFRVQAILFTHIQVDDIEELFI